MKAELKMKIGNERRLWSVNPITKVVKSKKTYNRNREKRSVKEIKESEV